MDPNNQYELFAKRFSVMVDFEGLVLFSVLLHFDMEYNIEIILLLIYLVRESKISIVITFLFSLFLDVQHALTILQFYSTFFVITKII